MAAIDNLLAIMARLRDPEQGCPWDIEQTFATIAPYTIEEAYEVADAIARQDNNDLKKELGDLLLQVVYHAQIAREAGFFDFHDVVAAVTAKMIRRHPHVFGDTKVEDARMQSRAWEDQKALERQQNAALPSLLDDLPLALPALTRAAKLQRRAARGGFDWPSAEPVFDKIEEEIRELRDEIATAARADGVIDEFGDLLFALANLARHLNVDPEEALRRANRKFERRIRHMEAMLRRDGQTMAETPLDQLEALWQAAKSAED